MRPYEFPLSSLKTTVIVAALVSLAACGRSAPKAQAAPEAPPAAVTVIKVQSESVLRSDELPGRVVALRTADIRPQVGGIVLRRLFEQGAEVKAGQKLFQLNAAPFQADADAADAALQQALATSRRAAQQAERLQPLMEADAVSRQAYDDAVAQRDQAAASVAQARAALARRRLELAFASIEAPIAGRIGSELVSEGALVGQADASPMARIEQIDKVYVDVRQRATSLAAGTTGAGSEPVTIIGADGQPYPHAGKVLFAGTSVDTGTGDTIVRVLVDNPQRQLLPGMFVRARIARGAPADTVLVPQQAVQRSSDGQAQVWVIDGARKASLRPVQVEEVLRQQYVVAGGLKAGETLVVEGQERLQPGAVVAPQPWQHKAATAAAKAAAAH